MSPFKAYGSQTAVAPGVHRLGDARVNFYLVEDGDALTLVDAGLPTSWARLVDHLAVLGRPLEQVRAVLVTHAHPDHIGIAERLRTQVGARVWVHESDAPMLATPRQAARYWRPERSLLRYVARRPAALGGPLHLVRNGGLRVPGVGEMHLLRPDERVDVPGRPYAVHVPGHTAGSTAFLFPDHGVAFTGDALVTEDAAIGRTGPCLICRAFTQDSRAAMASLDVLAGLDARLTLTGHGQPWPDAPAGAAREARAAGIA